MVDPTEDLPLFSSTVERSAGEAAMLRPDSSLSAAIAAWGEALEEEGKSIHTVKAFTADLRLVAKFLGGGISLDAIGTHDLKNFLEWMLNRRGVPCSPKTYARRITSIKAFFRWLQPLGVRPDNPADPIPQQTVVSPLPVVLTSAEINKVLAAAEAFNRSDEPDPRPYTLVALLLETGIKKGECLAIHLNHVDLQSPDGPILFVRYGDVTKRYKERKLRLDPNWVPLYEAYLRKYAPTDVVFPWSPRRLEYLLEEVGAAAGLEKHLSFDMCRWTAALMDYRAGVDKNKIRQTLGISKIQWREVGKKLSRLAETVE